MALRLSRSATGSDKPDIVDLVNAKPERLAIVRDIAVVLGAVGGAAITKLYAPGSTGFA